MPTSTAPIRGRIARLTMTVALVSIAFAALPAQGLASSAPQLTSTSLTSSFNPAKAGLGITITAHVSASTGQPRGTVVLMDGATQIGTGHADPTGTAAFTLVTLSQGTHNITAVYKGARAYAASTSATLTQQILPYNYVGAAPYAYEAGPVTDGTDVTRMAQALAGTAAKGISWKFRWADLEPAPGTYDWTPIDNAIGAAQAMHLSVVLRVIAGIYSPNWVFSTVPTVSIPNTYFPSTTVYANPTTVPVPWSGAYLGGWNAFISAFGARYDGNPSVFMVQTSGGGIIGEMYLPPDMSAWNAVSYSDSALLSASEQILTTYATAFPTTPLGLDIDEPLVCTGVSPGFTNPTCASTYKSNVLGPLAAWVAAKLPNRVWMQQNSLAGKWITDGIFRNRQILIAACEDTTTGYQMAGPAAGSADLRNAFTVARQDQVSYVEVYTADLLTSAYASDFQYLEAGTS